MLYNHAILEKVKFKEIIKSRKLPRHQCPWCVDVNFRPQLYVWHILNARCVKHVDWEPEEVSAHQRNQSFQLDCSASVKM